MQYLNSFSMDAVAKILLHKLIECKNKVTVANKQKFYWVTVFYICFSAFFLILYFFSIAPNWPDFYHIFTHFFSHSYNLFLAFLTISVFGFSVIKEKKRKKAESDFEQLRIEIIRRSEELWPSPNEWEMRNKLFNYLEETFDINLYHETKL